jgi:hypothetical protein
VETIPGNGGGWIKENGGGGQFKYDICKNSCKCHNACPAQTYLKKKKVKNGSLAVVMEKGQGK